MNRASLACVCGRSSAPLLVCPVTGKCLFDRTVELLLVSSGSSLYDGFCSWQIRRLGSLPHLLNLKESGVAPWLNSILKEGMVQGFVRFPKFPRCLKKNCMNCLSSLYTRCFIGVLERGNNGSGPTAPNGRLREVEFMGIAGKNSRTQAPQDDLHRRTLYGKRGRHHLRSK